MSCEHGRTYLVVCNKGGQVLDHVPMITLPQQLDLVDAVLARFSIRKLQDLELGEGGWAGSNPLKEVGECY